MNYEFEVLVLGGGVAGVAAALAAAGRGRRTGLLRAAPGATALAAGAWRGPLPDGLAAALAAAGESYSPAPGPLPHPSGALHACDHAPPPQRAAVLEEGALVCGITGLAGFHAPALATLWGDAAGVATTSATLDAGGTPPAGWSPAALAAALDRDPGPLAEALAGAVRAAGAPRAILPAVLGLERSAFVLEALGGAAGVPVGEALGVPPSLPGWRLERALAAALDVAGVAVVTGRAVAREVSGRRVVAVQVRRIAPAGGDATVRLAAGSFVLATGKFLAGGLAAGDRLEEPALGCPVQVGRSAGAKEEWTDRRRWDRPDRAGPGHAVLATGRAPADGIAGPAARSGFAGDSATSAVDAQAPERSAAPAPDAEPAEPAEPLALTRPERAAAQPLLRAGVRADGDGRPVDRWGDVVYENVRVAGSIRAGCEAATLGLGDAALDGWRAGERAAT